MFDTMAGAPISDGLGNEFPIVGYKKFEPIICLIFHCALPDL